MFKNRTNLYIKSSLDRKTEFIGLTNEISESIGHDFPANVLAPLLLSLDASDFISILLDEIFFTVITILSILAIILIYSLLLADVEEKTFEYGLVRCLGMTHGSIMKVLFSQAVTFSFPAILMALLLSFWI